MTEGGKKEIAIIALHYLKCSRYNAFKGAVSLGNTLL